MATFGAVVPTDTYAADALRSVDTIMAEIEQWHDDQVKTGQRTFRINAAVASGPISFGAVGDDTRLEYTVIGAPVNLSAKLEKYNKDIGSKALTTKASYDLALRQEYQPAHKPEMVKTNVLGITGVQELVILAR
jgi:adenylate cyclase